MSKTTEIVKAGLAKRYAREKRFRFYGMMSIVISILFLAILMVNIFSKGLPAFSSTYVKLDVKLDAETLGVTADATPQALRNANYSKVVQNSLQALFPDVTERQQKRALKALVSSNAPFRLQEMVMAEPSLIGSQQSVKFLADDDIDVFYKNDAGRNLPETDRRIKDYQIAWLDKLQADGRISTGFNTTFFTSGDSREPEQAGILSALMGSFYTMLVTLFLSFPIGVAAAIYLEEFAPKTISGST